MSPPDQAARPGNNYSSSPPGHRARRAGWVVELSLFAGVMMILTGVLNAMEGVVALARNEVYGGNDAVTNGRDNESPRMPTSIVDRE